MLRARARLRSRPLACWVSVPSGIPSERLSSRASPGQAPSPLGMLRTRGDATFLFLCALPQLFESLQAGDDLIPLSRPAAAYEEALQLVKEGKVPCRTLRRACGEGGGEQGQVGWALSPLECSLRTAVLWRQLLPEPRRV